MSTNADNRLASTQADGTFASEIQARALDALSRGGLVALPTETVYGLAARADSPEALAALWRAKQRAPERALTWHVAGFPPLPAFPDLRAMTARLVERYWPGPLTLVLQNVPPGLEHISQDGWCGMRQPAHPGTAAVLAAADFPIVMTSANLSGGTPLAEPQEILETFGEHLELVVDDGPPRLGEPSAVLRLGAGHFELLREGLHDINSLRSVAGLSLAFCCTGNTCRSPMAEAITRQALANALGLPQNAPAHNNSPALAKFGFQVQSMGVFAGIGAPASPEAVEVMKTQNYDLSHHGSQPAASVRLADLDLIFGLTRSHVAAICNQLPPDQEHKVKLLDPEGQDVPDPIGGTMQDYTDCAASMQRMIEARLSDWVG